MSLAARILFNRSECPYSPTHRIIEIFAIAAFFVLLAITAGRVATGLLAYPWYQALAIVLTTAGFGYVCADFVSGFVHWMGDTFGTEDMPVLGPGFIKPFRHHHVDPLAITRHDFIEVNGNNSIVLMLPLVPLYFLVPAADSLWQIYVLSFFVVFSLGIFMTNQFHKWSHMDEPPALVSLLQRHSLILSPTNHDIHHTAPYDTYYCITCGWLNPILHRLRFFERMELLIRRTTGIRRAES